MKQAGQSDIVVLTAGSKPKPGATRLSSMDKNFGILKDIISDLSPINPDAVLIVVTNPPDVLAYFAQKFSGLPQKQVRVLA